MIVGDGAMVLGRGVQIIWIRIGQGPTTLAVGAAGVVWTFFSSLSWGGRVVQ